tara:strand:- start:1893 stop:2303 length:411 start_codon:yes stop_codon:yes gene_type:complete
MAYATDEDLVAIVPDIFDHGVESFTVELTRSEGDIQRRIKADWWSISHDPTIFDKTKLIASEWKRTTIYHALAYYILPRLSNFQADDTFQRQMTFYKERYSEEFSAVLAAGISYDLDGDGVYESGEVDFIKERLYR